MQAQRIRPSGARVELRRMIGQQRRQVVATSDGVYREILTPAELGETAVRSADTRAFEVVNVGVGQQMKPRRELHDLDLATAVIGDDCLVPRRDQQVETVVVTTALAFHIMQRTGRSRMLQRVEAKQPARSQLVVVGSGLRNTPVEQPRNQPVLVDAEPGAARPQVLAADNARAIAEGSRRQRGAIEEFVAIGGDYD